MEQSSYLFAPKWLSLPSSSKPDAGAVKSPGASSQRPPPSTQPKPVSAFDREFPSLGGQSASTTSNISIAKSSFNSNIHSSSRSSSGSRSSASHREDAGGRGSWANQSRPPSNTATWGPPSTSSRRDPPRPRPSSSTSITTTTSTSLPSTIPTSTTTSNRPPNNRNKSSSSMRPRPAVPPPVLVTHSSSRAAANHAAASSPLLAGNAPNTASVNVIGQNGGPVSYSGAAAIAAGKVSHVMRPVEEVDHVMMSVEDVDHVMGGHVMGRQRGGQRSGRRGRHVDESEVMLASSSNQNATMSVSSNQNASLHNSSLSSHTSSLSSHNASLSSHSAANHNAAGRRVSVTSPIDDDQPLHVAAAAAASEPPADTWDERPTVDAWAEEPIVVATVDRDDVITYDDVIIQPPSLSFDDLSEALGLVAGEAEPCFSENDKNDKNDDKISDHVTNDHNHVGSSAPIPITSSTPPPRNRSRFFGVSPSSDMPTSMLAADDVITSRDPFNLGWSDSGDAGDIPEEEMEEFARLRGWGGWPMGQGQSHNSSQGQSQGQWLEAKAPRRSKHFPSVTDEE